MATFLENLTAKAAKVHDEREKSRKETVEKAIEAVKAWLNKTVEESGALIFRVCYAADKHLRMIACEEFYGVQKIICTNELEFPYELRELLGKELVELGFKDMRDNIYELRIKFD